MSRLLTRKMFPLGLKPERGLNILNTARPGKLGPFPGAREFGSFLIRTGYCGRSPLKWSGTNRAPPYDAVFPGLRSPVRSPQSTEGRMSSLAILLLSTCLAGPPMGPPKPPTPAPAPSTEAEKIARLERYIEEDEKQLAAVKKQLANPCGEYARAQAAFKELD